MNLAQRSLLLAFTDIVKIRDRVMDMRSRGRRVLQLEGGEPFMATPGFIKDAMCAALDADQTHYASSSGVPQLLDALRAKLARKNQIIITSDNIIVTPGGGHGLFCAFQVTVNPGDDVLSFGPYWTPIRDMVQFCGGTVVSVPWSDIRADATGSMTTVLESCLTQRTRVLYVNTPANPTGDVLTREQLTVVADFAKTHDLVVIADEAYEDLIYDGEHVSIASLPEMPERTITIYTFSKSYAMTGWRIGYVVAPPDAMECLRRLVLTSVHCVSTPTQYAALAAVTQDFSFDPLRNEYRRRRDLLISGFRDAGFDCPAPAGTFYAFPDVSRRLGNDSWKAMETLLERASIASVPGVVFGPDGEGHLRMSFSTSLETLEEAIRALKQV